MLDNHSLNTMFTQEGMMKGKHNDSTWDFLSLPLIDVEMSGKSCKLREV